MRHRRSRLRRVLKWAGLSGCLLLTLLFIAVQFRCIGYKGNTWFLAVRGAGLGIGWGGQWPGWSLGDGWFVGKPWGRFGFFLPRVKPISTGGKILHIPHCLTIPAVGIPTARLCWRHRRPAKGHCQNCGYDLTGNTSGRCPECGQRA